MTSLYLLTPLADKHIMPDQGGLQLLPETRKKIEITTPGENRLIVAGGVVLVVAAILAGGLYFYTNFLEDRLAVLDTEITTLEQKREKQSEQKILVFNKQASTLSNILNDHAYWTTAFSKIEGLLQNQVQLSNMTTSLSDSKIDFRATAASYTTIARQIAAFLSDESIKDIALNRVNVLTNGRLEFNMQILFDKSKFLKSR